MIKRDQSQGDLVGQDSPSPDGVSSDKQQTRMNAILTALQQTGAVSVEELSKELGVSAVTIRRDLDELATQSRLLRTHGGAVSIEPLFYEPFRNDGSFQAQVEKLADEKRRIGRAAASLIKEGETIALTPGTTTTEVIRGLPLNQKITVVTSTVNVAMELSKRKDLKVFVTGGHLHGEWFSLVGPTAVQSLSHVVIHTLFVGAEGIDANSGVTCYSPDEVYVSSALVRRARRKIVVVDHTKFGKVAGWRICPISEIDVLVTDSETTEQMLAPFENAQLKIIRV
jgi:DeoR family transcriptional regulator, aga operon transcriptional repressor